MNYIKIYGELKYISGNKSHYCSYIPELLNWTDTGIYTEFEFYHLKLDRLIHLLEYKFKILDYKPMDKKTFNFQIAQTHLDEYV